MSSEDELAEVTGADSPVVTKPVHGRASKSSQRPVAGPSQTKGTSGGASNGKRKAGRGTSEVPGDKGKGALHENSEIEISDTEASVQVVAGGKGKAKSVPAKVTNGQAAGVDKGKAVVRTRIAKKTASRISPVDEDIEMIQELATEPSYKRTKVSESHGSADRAAPQLKKMQKQLNDAIAIKDALSKQLEEVLGVRKTGIEELSEQQKATYESRLKSQELIIQELTTQLARVEPLARSGHTSSLHFLTREAVDEEKQSLEQEVSRLKDAAKQREKEVVELKQREKELQYELDAEIERSKSLFAHAPPSMHKGRTKGKESATAEGRVIRFYEDLTNMLVTNHSTNKSAHEGFPDEFSYNCLYTHVETSIALAFNLHFYTEALEDSGDLIDRVKYSPRDLDKESPEFQQRLGFLANSFMFERAQLNVFLRSIAGQINKVHGEDEGDLEEEDIAELAYPE